MVTRARAHLSQRPPNSLAEEATQDAEALRALSALDALTIDGEPIVSVHRTSEDGPYEVEVLFTAKHDLDAVEGWLDVACEAVGSLAFTIDPLAARDWVAESQKALQPVRGGPFVVHGSHDTERLPPSRYNLEIDAGAAFGTAHHASTKGCLIALTMLARRGALGTVADVGTGSGILAIAADRLGGTVVGASDIDPDAVRVAKDNARRARLRAHFDVTVAAGPARSADTVVANILARPLIAMAHAMVRAAGANLVLSGLRRVDRRPVLAAYRAHGAILDHVITCDNWVTLILRTRPVRRGVRQP